MPFGQLTSSNGFSGEQFGGNIDIYATNYLEVIDRHNQDFIQEELHQQSQFFNSVAKFPLDEQQRKVIVADEDNNLVVAAAGSGKTLTVTAKVKYLVQKWGVPASSILPISFTNKSAQEMKERIQVQHVNPQTFHKFCIGVIEHVTQDKIQIYNGDDMKKMLEDIVDNLRQAPDYTKRLNDFFRYHVKIWKSQFDFTTRADYIQYMKSQNFTTYKQIVNRDRKTYRNETVKSIEECIIANFLFLNGVEYEYERQYEFPSQQSKSRKAYKPDFTIKAEGGNIYLEHLGLNRKNEVPEFFARENETRTDASKRYLKQLEWKRDIHQKNKTTLIESYSYEAFEETLLLNLAENLQGAGVKLKPMSDEQIWQIIQKSGKNEFDAFIQLIATFLALLKSNNQTIQDIRNKINLEGGQYQTRNENFIDLFDSVFQKYQQYLQLESRLDFSDIINQATQHISTGEYQHSLNYVIIDEFQDLSVGRYHLLQAIRQQNPDVKFYCVGDDWQSIYRFAGSDIGLFSKFEHYFGFTKLSKLETTYRFHDPLIDISSQFILKNPAQKKKVISSVDAGAETNVKVFNSEASDDLDGRAVKEALNWFMDSGMTPKDIIYVLGRYKFDIDRLKDWREGFSVNYNQQTVKYKEFNMNFFTAHKAKGIEAEYIIIINVNAGKYGFPSGKSDDPVLNLILSSSDHFEDGEERRLFYVAMTRAKKGVAIVTDQSRQSKFIAELYQDGIQNDNAYCPQCGGGTIVTRRGPWGIFRGCSNFAYGCDYTQPKKSLKETKPERSKTQSSPTRNPASRLSQSDINKLHAFLKQPKAYAVSEKGRQKVVHLKNLEYQMSGQQLFQFRQAYAVWEAR